MGCDQVVQSTAKSCDPVSQLVSKSPVPRLQTSGNGIERAIESPTAFCFEANGEGRRAARRGPAQSSIPAVGEDGTAISREGMRPAR